MNILEKIKNSKSMSGIVRLLKNDNDLYKIVLDRTSYLDFNVSVNERLYNIKNDIFQVKYCSICKNKKLKWNVKYKKYKNTCDCKECKIEYMILNRDNEKEILRRKKISQTQKNKTEEEKKIILNKIKKTNLKKYNETSYAKTNEFKSRMLDKYGYISPFELKETHDKSKKTLIKRYNCDHNFKIDEVKKNRKKTFLKQYGVDNPTKCQEIKNKIIKTNNDKYGGNSPMCNDDIKNKSKNTYIINCINNKINKNDILHRREITMLNKYGVKYWMQNSENQDNLNKKTSYKKYEFNGIDVFLQGYEDYVLFNILLKKYNFEDICILNSDIEKYTDKIYYNYNEKKHKYYPDFYIISENKVYEVKSDYTYESDIEVNNIKKNACIDKGLDFEFIIIHSKEYKNWKKEFKNKNN